MRALGSQLDILEAGGRETRETSEVEEAKRRARGSRDAVTSQVGVGRVASEQHIKQKIVVDSSCSVVTTNRTGARSLSRSSQSAKATAKGFLISTQVEGFSSSTASDTSSRICRMSLPTFLGSFEMACQTGPW